MKRLSILLMFSLACCLNLGCDLGVETTETLDLPSTSDSAEANDGGETVAKDLGQLNAEDVLSQSLAVAKSQNKNVFVHVGAPW